MPKLMSEGRAADKRKIPMFEFQPQGCEAACPARTELPWENVTQNTDPSPPRTRRGLGRGVDFCLTADSRRLPLIRWGETADEPNAACARMFCLCSAISKLRCGLRRLFLLVLVLVLELFSNLVVTLKTMECGGRSRRAGGDTVFV